jgi:transcriptional regulator of met regulon
MKRERIESPDDAAPGGNGQAWTDPNPRHGEKAGFRKITTTVPQWAYRALIEESARRKIAGEPNQLLSALLREAITDYLRKTCEQSA